MVEHFLGKEEVVSSSLIDSSRNQEVTCKGSLFFVPFGDEKGAERAVRGALLDPLLDTESAAPDCLHIVQTDENQSNSEKRHLYVEITPLNLRITKL